MQISFKSVQIFVTIRGKTWQAQLGNCQNCLINNRQPHFRAVRKVLWKKVKNCVHNRSRPDEIDTETEICTSLKS